MAIDYVAFAGGKEIESFYLDGKEIEQIWGGNTLLWQKESIPDISARYAIRFIFEKAVYDDDGNLISDEAGFRYWVSDKIPVPKKIAYHVKTETYISYQKTYEKFLLAVGLLFEDMETDYSNQIVVGPYAAHEGTMNGMAFGDSYFAKKGEDGIYSWGRSFDYSDVYANTTASPNLHIGSLLSDNAKAIRTTDGARIFYSLEKMKAWLLSDD